MSTPCKCKQIYIYTRCIMILHLTVHPTANLFHEQFSSQICPGTRSLTKWLFKWFSHFSSISPTNNPGRRDPSVIESLRHTLLLILFSPCDPGLMDFLLCQGLSGGCDMDWSHTHTHIYIFKYIYIYICIYISIYI